VAKERADIPKPIVICSKKEGEREREESFSISENQKRG
jgi:hypothetical protein